MVDTTIHNNRQFVATNYHRVMISAALEKVEDRQHLKLAFCIALYLVLALLWMPGFDLSTATPRAGGGAAEGTRMERKILRPPPLKPVARKAIKRLKARKVPMPDLTPDLPEPSIGVTQVAAPDMIVPDEWETGLPNGVPSSRGKGFGRGGGEGNATIAMVGDPGVTAPIILLRVPPDYPTEAVKVRMQGFVVLDAVLRENGTVEVLEVIQNLGGGKFGFEEAASTAITQWQFEPGRVNGVPADVRMRVKVDFILH
jgi:protein TonB